VVYVKDVLEQAMVEFFRMRGVLDPSRAAEGLGASVSEALALRFIAVSSPTQLELADHLGLEKSTVSRLVDGMEAKGWVSKTRNSDNRRFVSVALTEQGLEAESMVAEGIQARHGRMLEGLSVPERQALKVGLPALLRVLSETAQPD
jgi:DNA-binding MarR family transcriptional regulator